MNSIYVACCAIQDRMILWIQICHSILVVTPSYYGSDFTENRLLLNIRFGMIYVILIISTDIPSWPSDTRALITSDTYQHANLLSVVKKPDFRIFLLRLYNIDLVYVCFRPSHRYSTIIRQYGLSCFTRLKIHILGSRRIFWSLWEAEGNRGSLRRLDAKI